MDGRDDRKDDRHGGATVRRRDDWRRSDEFGRRDPDGSDQQGGEPDRGWNRWSRAPGPDVGSRVRAVVLALALAISGFVVSIPLFVLVGLFVDGEALGAVETTVLGLVVLQGISFPLVALGFLWTRRIPFGFLRVRWPSVRDLGLTVVGYTVAFGLVVAALVVITSVGAPTAERAESDTLQNADVLLTLIPLSVLLIGPGEELLFRGVIQGTLRQVFSAPAAIVLTSATFAPAHVLALTGSPRALAVSIAVLFLPSLVFGAVYEVTGNLVVPALIHGLYNATVYGVVYLSVTAGEATLLF